VPGERGRVLVRETQPVHLACHGQAAAGIGPLSGLGFHEGGGAAEGAAGGVVAHAVFPDPADCRAGLSQHAHGLVGDAGAGAEEEGADGRGGDVGGALGVLGGDGVGVAVDGAAFEVDEGEALVGAGELSGSEGRAFGDAAHGVCGAVPGVGASVSRPQP
jgi:hypothetical protein